MCTGSKKIIDSVFHSDRKTYKYARIGRVKKKNTQEVDFYIEDSFKIEDYHCFKDS